MDKDNLLLQLEVEDTQRQSIGVGWVREPSRSFRLVGADYASIERRVVALLMTHLAFACDDKVLALGTERVRSLPEVVMPKDVPLGKLERKPEPYYVRFNRTRKGGWR